MPVHYQQLYVWQRKALSLIGIMTGDEGMAMKYGLKADSIKTLVQDKLWNTDHHS